MSEFLQRLKSHPFVLRNQQSLQFLNRLMAEYPSARFHRQVFQELGCDFSYAGRDSDTGCWHAIVDLNTDLQKMLGMTSGIQIMYTPFADLQPRTIEAMRKRVIDRNAVKLSIFYTLPTYLPHGNLMIGHSERLIQSWLYRVRASQAK